MYSPSSFFNAIDSIKFWTNDGEIQSKPAIVTIEILAIDAAVFFSVILTIVIVVIIAIISIKISKRKVQTRK